jgi:diaminopimelate decarboxylase
MIHYLHNAAMERLNLFPASTKIIRGTLHVGGCDLVSLAEEKGTPLYIYDQATLDAAVDSYRKSLVDHYPGEAGLTYAGKAFLCIGLAQWAYQRNLCIDCTGRVEIAIAVKAGLPAEKLVVHGVNKSREDLLSTLQHAGVIVIDNLSELAHLFELGGTNPLPSLWLRYQPGMGVDTHPHIQTGQAGSKFGMDETQLLQAAALLRGKGIQPAGLHFHLGSQIFDPRVIAQATRQAVLLAKEVGFGEQWVLCPGGGWGVPYIESDITLVSQDQFIQMISNTILETCRKHELSLPTLQLEPGRSLVAQAGVALYRVGVIKNYGEKRWALLDGGLADNPRPAMYGAKYTALPVCEPLRLNQELFSFAGPFCESGDTLISDLPFPEIQEGDLVAVPVSGAYQLSMASNYNGSLRPAVVWVKNGSAKLLQERETVDGVLQRDHRLSNGHGEGKIKP